jgi:hypothetical protein
MIIDKESVSATLDAVNAAMFEGRALRPTERERVARWLAARQGLTGAYANTFAGGFPFWYTALALCEMDHPEAKAELKYAAPQLERTAERSPSASVYGRRRHELARRALQRI